MKTKYLRNTEVVRKLMEIKQLLEKDKKKEAMEVLTFLIEHI